jgi:RNA methyltransferase, TrmH family
MLTSLKNPLVQQIRALHQAKGRREQGQFLLEGSHLVEEACALGMALEILCYTDQWQAQAGALWGEAVGLAGRSALVSPEVLKAMATTVQPDGVVAVATRRRQPLAFQSLGLVLETIQDPGNLGTMIRTTAAAGGEGLLVSQTSVDLDHPKVLRASAGQWLRLPMGVSPDLAADLRAHKAAGLQIVATLPTATQSYWDVDLRPPTLILLGNEGAGLSPELVELADLPVTIPLAAGVESLNVAIAAALILYEARRQRGAG